MERKPIKIVIEEFRAEESRENEKEKEAQVFCRNPRIFCPYCGCNGFWIKKGDDRVKGEKKCCNRKCGRIFLNASPAFPRKK